MKVTYILKKMKNYDFNKQNYSLDECEGMRQHIITKIPQDKKIIELLNFCSSYIFRLQIHIEDLKQNHLKNQNLKYFSAHFMRCNLSGSEFEKFNISGMNLMKQNSLIVSGGIQQQMRGRVNNVCFSFDGQILVYCNCDNFILFLDVRTRNKKSIFKCKRNAQCVCFQPTLHLHLVVQTILSNYEMLRQDNKKPIQMNNSISPDGTTQVSGGDHKSIRLWDVKTAKEILSQDDCYKDLLNQFKFPRQSQSISYNTNFDRTILRICQNQILEALKALILYGELSIIKDQNQKSLFKSKRTCILENQIELKHRNLKFKKQNSIQFNHFRNDIIQFRQIPRGY
ncbi:unnamed protein product [Paramecium octaurelia]|uniref:Uncharacterized protein n=1 Tax=Paramecium octaurelia TaxID=43137 RepID=A0A8S1W0S9_PAROT|nr:unnamed protein product [Paramecium octaurelia]